MQENIPKTVNCKLAIDQETHTISIVSCDISEQEKKSLHKAIVMGAGKSATAVGKSAKAVGKSLKFAITHV